MPLFSHQWILFRCSLCFSFYWGLQVVNLHWRPLVDPMVQVLPRMGFSVFPVDGHLPTIFRCLTEKWCTALLMRVRRGQYSQHRPFQEEKKMKNFSSPPLQTQGECGILYALREKQGLRLASNDLNFDNWMKNAGKTCFPLMGKLIRKSALGGNSYWEPWV